jgi:exodeoxyribonuclease-3
MGVQEIKADAGAVVGRFDRLAGLTGHFHYVEKKGCFPSGSSGAHRQAAKFRFLDHMAPYLARLATEREPTTASRRRPSRPWPVGSRST